MTDGMPGRIQVFGHAPAYPAREGACGRGERDPTRGGDIICAILWLTSCRLQPKQLCIVLYFYFAIIIHSKYIQFAGEVACTINRKAGLFSVNAQICRLKA